MEWQRAVSLLGLFVMLGLAALLSAEVRRVKLRPIAFGIVLQLLFAYIVLKTAAGRALFEGVRVFFTHLLDISQHGGEFVFGPLGEGDRLERAFGPDRGFLFAVTVSCTIIFVSSLMAMLYHIGLMQLVVWLMAKVMHWTMGTSGSESLAAAANVFVGQTEAPLIVRPYLAGMTSSELHALMCGGMATVAGGVLAAYVGFGIDAGHLLAASVMSAPAALVVAKIIVPETDRSETSGTVPFDRVKRDHNLLDAACRGAGEGLKLALNVLAMLIAFISLVALINWPLGHLSEGLTLERALGWVFCPLAWVMGVPWEDAGRVGQLLGTKMVLNEFIAYVDLSRMMQELSPRSAVIATYALCGFANFSSIAIQIGGIGALEESIRPQLARLGLRAMLGGTLAAMMTATIAGVFI